MRNLKVKTLLPFHPAFVRNNFQKVIIYSKLLLESIDVRTDHIIGKRLFVYFLTGLLCLSWKAFNLQFHYHEKI